jgi:hypothetical protein
MQLQLKKFDIKSITDDSVVVFIGKRRTGKSFLVRDVLYHHKDVPIGTLISATESANKYYSDMIPSLFIHDEYTASVVENVVKRQKIIIKKINKEKERNGNCKIDPRAFLILDDCLFDNTWVRDKNVISIFLNGRHYKMLFMITMQYPLGIPPSLRTNLDYVFILRENNMSNRRRIYENYAGMIPSFELFNEIMDQCTENYECLVLKINAQSNKLEDQIFWYKAETHEDFKIGAKEFWAMHHANIANGSGEEDDELFDVRHVKKKGSNVNIKKIS